MTLYKAKREREKHIGLLKCCVGVVADSGLPVPQWDSVELTERLRKILKQRDAALRVAGRGRCNKRAKNDRSKNMRCGLQWGHKGNHVCHCGCSRTWRVCKR